MKALIQRVSHASVKVDDTTVGSIREGILLFVGFELERMAVKVLAYRLFPDPEGKMNLSVSDTGGGVLVVSQFTLAADTKKGLRPSFSSAAPPDKARELYEQFTARLKTNHRIVENGSFGADMKVALVNDGPVTIWLDTAELRPSAG